MGKTLMLKGLPFGIGLRTVAEACEQDGPISQIVVENAGVWEEPASIALVEFSRIQDADNARKALGNILIGNAQISVE